MKTADQNLLYQTGGWKDRKKKQRLEEMEMKRIGFIGMGNMAGAIAAGIIQKGLMKKDEVFAYAPHYDKLVKNAEKIGFIACKELKELVGKNRYFNYGM